jgi:Flp pilus assembly pilin Flp
MAPMNEGPAQARLRVSCRENVIASAASRRHEGVARASRTGDPAEMPLRHAQAAMLIARLRSDEGQTFVEYTLILAVVVVATMLAVSATPLGAAIQNAVTQVTNALAP